MTDAPADWIVQAWRHWHRPWSVTHAGWLDPAHARLATDGAREFALRLHYPAWCERYALMPTLRSFEDTPWWRLFSLAPARFGHAARRVGFALMFAAQPRTRLVRHAGDGDDAQLARTRWSLERARFLPDSLTAAVGESLQADGAVLRGRTTGADAPMHCASLSLQICIADIEPDLWARLKLRLDPDHLNDAPRTPRGDDVDGQAQAGRAALAALWADATRATMKETFA